MTELSTRLAALTPDQRERSEKKPKQQQARVEPAASPIRRRHAGELALLSFSQERLWFLEQLEGASPAYNVCSANRLHGPLNAQAMEQAFVEIVRRHETLRTTFWVPAPDEPPVQRIADAAAVQWEFLDLATQSAAERETAAMQAAHAFACRRMVLAQGPLFRVSLVRLSEEDHILVVVMHHIIADGWSIDILYRELATLYANHCSGRPSSLPPLPIQYADFVLWQRQSLQGSELERQLAYWKARLSGMLPLADLPSDFPRPAEQTYRGAYCERIVEPSLLEALRNFGQESRATLFMSLLAAFKALLFRYSGQNDILVGVPVSNRTRVELEPLIGFFVNMLVLRTEVSGDQSVRQLVERVRETTLSAVAHQELPFETLVRALHPERSLSRPPLFQVALKFQQDEQHRLQLPGLAIEPVTINTDTSKYDLTLLAGESARGLRLGLEYASDLFTAESAERLLAHFERLLAGMVQCPQARVSDLELLSPQETTRLLVDWNRTAAEYPRDVPLHALFEEQAKCVPQKVAAECGHERITYVELNRRAHALALELRRQGVLPDAPVGLYVERGLDMLVGLLGILKAGGAYVPLDPAFPKERLAYMVADAPIPVLVTQRRLASELPEHQGRIVCMDDLGTEVPADNVSLPVRRPNLAYILYTSGSTGRPKGVQISHRAVVNFLWSMRRSPGFSADDVMLAITTLSFDIAGLELFLPLVTGGKVVIAPREVTVDGPRLAGLIRDSGATVMQGTPATWRMLIESGWQGDKQLKILCGGEAFGTDLVDRLLRRGGELWNMYGPTETTIWSTTERLLPGQPITIGRPIANTEVYILDKGSRPVPVGVTGELYIGGDGVALGYLNLPELTRERFVPNPLDPTNPGRLYRTGDLARYRADGRIEFLGRADHQVKIRGFRIELGEIETALAKAEGVAQAVVVAREDALGDKRLVAYVVPAAWQALLASQTTPKNGTTRTAGDSSSAETFRNPDERLSAPALRTFLRQHLPEHMIPSAYVLLEAFPLTPNGKIDRKLLPPPGKSIGSQSESYEAPSGETEEKLATIMASLLRLPRVGRKENFFELGGHSILAVSLFNEIHRVFGKRLPLAALFRAPTTEQLAAVIATESQKAVRWASLVPIHAGGSKPRFFCIHGAGGNVLLYRDLALHFDGDHPFYGLQSQGLDGTSKPLKSVEEMAERYVREIREIQPEGPYCIGGYCLGGTIAYEMAQILGRGGQEVGLLALLDTYNFSLMEPVQPFRILRQKLTFHLSNLTRLKLRNWPGYFASKLRVARDGEFSGFLRTMRRKDGNKDRQRTGNNVHEINERAAAAYHPKPCTAPITVFKPRVNYSCFPDPQLGWGGLSSTGLQVVELQVNPHAMLVEPHVGELAAELQRRLDAVSGKQSQAGVRRG